jgi:hypothetical protein
MSDDNGAGARFSPDQLNALKDRNPVDAVAGQWVTLRRKGRAGNYIGPCPICSDDPHAKTATRFECNADKWVCAVCADGGDVIKLICKREGLDFRGALDRLGGIREEKPTPDMARKAGLRAFFAGDPLGEVPAPYGADNALRVAFVGGWSQGRKRADFEQRARLQERDNLRGFVKASTAIAGTPVEQYLALRGLVAPANARIRFHPSMPLFCDGRAYRPVMAHRGPAMLAPFYDAEGNGIGLHITWLDLSQPKGKVIVHNPETGEVLPSKKMRGTKAGGFIDLGGATDPARLIAGEGIETVLAVYTALIRAGRDISRTAFRAAGDLGNLAGRALNAIAHPTLKTANNRAQRVPGPDPDLNSPAMPVPESVTGLSLLGDGDSDPFLTRNALERSARRNARDGRSIRVHFAAAGLDFNDMMQGKKNDR